MKKIRVLQVCYGFSFGGIRAFITNCLKFIDKSQFEVDIYAFGCESSPFEEFVRNQGANIYFEPQNNAQKHIIRFISQLEKFIKEHGPYDVVHAHCNLISAWVLLAAKRARVPMRVAHSHSTAHFYGGLLQKSYSHIRRFVIDKLATHKVACGQLAGETMYGKQSSFHIVSNGIDIDSFLYRNESQEVALRKKLNIPEGGKVYTSVSRLDSNKNIEYAVEVFKEIGKKTPNSILICGGVEPQMNSTKEIVLNKINEYKLQEKVRLIGPIKGIEHLYHLSDVWLFCSRYEGFPFVPIELQAAGVPVLVSDTITKEIDLDLGLVEFISLDELPEIWASKAIEKNKISIDASEIRAAFKKHNLDIKESVKNLGRIYKGEVQ